MNMNLLDAIRTKIQKEGGLPFVEFMQQALYDPHFGYYTAGLQKFGAGGDFITAPELTPLFGKALANQCCQVMAALESPSLFEFGAGSGHLCVDILTHLESLQCLPSEYFILELSSELKARQQAWVKSQIPHLASRVKWLSEWPEQTFQGIVIANEVLDAMPVHRFLRTEDGLLESVVKLDHHGELQETFEPCHDQRLIDHVQLVLTHENYPYLSEANLFLDGWILSCYKMLEKGAVILIDYGFPRHEYYHPDRYQGTLMCHYQHRAHPDPLVHVGEQDMTAHVDFTHVAEAAQAAGFDVSGYTNQAAFLIGNGLLSLLEATETSVDRLQAVKKLVQPNEMGELFKVIALTKNIDLPWNGFQWQDKRASL